MKFSQKIGKTPVRQSLQIESIDKPLENRIWNNFLSDFMNPISYYSQSEEISKIIWEEFFQQRTDEIPISYYSNGEIDIGGIINYTKQWFFKSEWFEKYDFVEFIALLEDKVTGGKFTERCNQSLKKESAGYRILEEKVVQITAEEEIQAIEEALTCSSSMKPVETHLRTALDYLSNRENPDYRNSVKESISAVESFCNVTIGDEKETLGKALIQIEKSHKIHPALKSAFSSLYGYTSDSGGIRHSLLEEDVPVTMEDAKFMLVSCSAFINYLTTKNKN